MAEIINLRRARRAAAREREAEQAANNRQIHGAPKAERLRARAARETSERRLDGARLTGEPDLSD